MSRSTRVLFSCTGVGIINRGIETFFREAFDALHDCPGLTTKLVKGGGLSVGKEERVWLLPRTGWPAKAVGALVRRNGYVAEQLSSLLPIVRVIRRFRPDVVFYSDSNLGFQLYRWRRAIGVDFRLLFSNGGPCSPPFNRHDFVHQVAPLYHEQALAAGEPDAKHILVPYGFHLPPDPPTITENERAAIRRTLGLPVDRSLLLSVGWISATHKRMDYVIREVAQLPAPRPFLVLLGAMDESSAEIQALARDLLGPNGCVIRSVGKDQVADYYRSADAFVLASLREGFGRVYVEALGHGLPVVAHRHPVMEYVVGEDETLLDLSVEGALASHLCIAAASWRRDMAGVARWDRVRRQFGWPVVRSQYRSMFEVCAQQAGKAFGSPDNCEGTIS